MARYFLLNYSITTHNRPSTVASATILKRGWPCSKTSFRDENVRINITPGPVLQAIRPSTPLSCMHDSASGHKADEPIFSSAVRCLGEKADLARHPSEVWF